jgi:hypothetical protein
LESLDDILPFMHDRLPYCSAPGFTS